MSRKYLDDNAELRLTINDGLGFSYLPGQNDQHYDSGHQALDPFAGIRFTNEGASDRNSSLFVSERYNALILQENFATKPLIGAHQSGSTNTAFSVIGTNAADTCVAFSTAAGNAGGIVMTTTTTANDQVILSPDTNSVWGSITYIADSQVVFEAQVVTGASVASIELWAGFKLTNTSTVATDDDQTFFRFSDADDAFWHTVDSTSGTDNNVATTVAVTASTTYLLQIRVGSDLKPRYFINGVLVATGNALTTGTALLPFVGVQTTTTAAKVLLVRSVRIVLPRKPIA